MTTVPLDGMDLNYWVAWVLDAPPGRLAIVDSRCRRLDELGVHYINAQCILSVFREKRFFDTSRRDQLTEKIDPDPLERFVARLTRSEGSCEACGPTALIAVCRVVVMFALRYGLTALPDGPEERAEKREGRATS